MWYPYPTYRIMSAGMKLISAAIRIHDIITISIFDIGNWYQIRYPSDITHSTSQTDITSMSFRYRAKRYRNDIAIWYHTDSLLVVNSYRNDIVMSMSEWCHNDDVRPTSYDDIGMISYTIWVWYQVWLYRPVSGWMISSWYQTADIISCRPISGRCRLATRAY